MLLKDQTSVLVSRLTSEGAATEAASSHDQTADCLDQVALASTRERL